MHVEGDVHPAGGRIVDELDAAPRRVEPVAGDEVGDLQPHARALRRAQRLLDCLVGTSVSMPRVRCVDPVPPAAHLAHRDELVLVGSPLGRVLETGRVAPGALLERLVEEVAHLRQLVRSRGTVFEPYHRQPDLAVRREAQRR